MRAATAVRGLRRAPAPRPTTPSRGRASQYVSDWRTGRLDAEGFRRLSLALAIAGDPDLVVLDDPWVLSDTLREIAAARAGAAPPCWWPPIRPAGLAPALGRRITLADGAPR